MARQRKCFARPAEIGSAQVAGAGGTSRLQKAILQASGKELVLTRRIDRCRLVNWTDPEYPQTRLQIYDPPVMLYVRGDAQVLNLPAVSIVGTRRPTLYRTHMAERTGRELAARGLVVVSGHGTGY